MKALLVGRNHSLAWALPELLAEAGFQVDAINSSKWLGCSRFLTNFDWVPSCQSLIPTLRKKLACDDQWVIVTDDGVLQEILDSTLSKEEKLKALPVLSEEHFSHLFSKIGLSKALAQSEISTPPFFVARHFGEAVLRAREIGYPLLVKQDASAGGEGVFECEKPSDFERLPRTLFSQPVLVQKKIEGIELDLSSLFLQGELIHFSYSMHHRTARRFGPSYLRTFFHSSQVDLQIVEDLRMIGKALGAHGFTNIGCIERPDGKRFYFEVDMRPNVWVPFTRYLGEDPSLRIRDWFKEKKRFERPSFEASAYPKQITIPYFLRLKRRELLSNRYNAWRFIPKSEPWLVSRLLLDRLL